MKKYSRRQVVVALLAAAASGTLRANLSPAAHHVEIAEFKYEPAMLEVDVGDTITWTNIDIVPHTATAKDGSWDTGSLAQGESASITVTESMSTEYICAFHPGMKAALKFGK